MFSGYLVGHLHAILFQRWWFLGVKDLEFWNQRFGWSKGQLLLIFTTTKWVLILYKVALREDYSPIMLNPFCASYK